MTLINLLLSIIAIFIVITIHEFSRALISTALGDKKPKQEGRLSLNPLNHFEPIGFILLLATGGFGWGKPVETSALYYKNRKRDTLLTNAIPTALNLIFAFLATFLFIRMDGNPGMLNSFLKYFMNYNVGIAVYNLIPVSPMDGAKVMSVLMPANQYFKYLQYEKMIQMLFLVFLFFGWTDFIFYPVIRFVKMILLMVAGI